MKAKEKAEELFDKYLLRLSLHIPNLSDYLVKECALITINEILKTNTLKDRNCGFVTLCEEHKDFWQEVKQELEKL